MTDRETERDAHCFTYDATAFFLNHAPASEPRQVVPGDFGVSFVGISSGLAATWAASSSQKTAPLVSGISNTNVVFMR